MYSLPYGSPHRRINKDSKKKKKKKKEHQELNLVQPRKVCCQERSKLFPRKNIRLGWGEVFEPSTVIDKDRNFFDTISVLRCFQAA